ncbi:MAG: SPOR domain-containing protein [Paludibacteraceae bacterium]|nr:SPOR domain-containing protein [Paludibacteraceae bacterium]
MKRLYLTSFAGMAVAFLMAQQPKKMITESMPNAVVHQDSAITRLIQERVFEMEHKTIEMAGFRVQIYSSNRQQEAKSEALLLEKDLKGRIDVPIYVSYNPPFWKVRLGDFKTQAEAQEYKNIFLKEHPELVGETYIVRDQIQVIQ